MAGIRGRGPRRWWRTPVLLPALLVLGGIVVDVFTPADFSGAPLYSAAPMAAAALLSQRATLLTGLAATAADTGQLAALGYLRTLGNYTEPATIVTVTIVALVINRLLRRSDLQAQSARSIAAAVQRAVLPHPPPAIGSLVVAARYEAAHAGARIGGDLYAVQETPYGVRCVVGDVRGKGLDAVEAVTVVLGAFREAADEEPSLLGLAARLERALLREGRRRAGLDQFEGFTTVLLAEIPQHSTALHLVNCGHPPPLLLTPPEADPKGTVPAVRTLEPSNPALPLGTALEAAGPVEDIVEFPHGGTLLMFTDGVTEARNRAGAFYDPADRLAHHYAEHAPDSDPDHLLDALLADVARHTRGSRTDDMALLAITRTAPPQAAPVAPPADAPSTASAPQPSAPPAAPPSPASGG